MLTNSTENVGDIQNLSTLESKYRDKLVENRNDFVKIMYIIEEMIQVFKDFWKTNKSSYLTTSPVDFQDSNELIDFYKLFISYLGNFLKYNTGFVNYILLKSLSENYSDISQIEDIQVSGNSGIIMAKVNGEEIMLNIFDDKYLNDEKNSTSFLSDLYKEYTEGGNVTAKMKINNQMTINKVNELLGKVHKKIGSLGTEGIDEESITLLNKTLEKAAKIVSVAEKNINTSK